MKYVAGVLTACILLSLAFTSVAQVATQLVVLHVRVTDESEKAVLDVDKSSFQVTEDGVPQKIELFINHDVPLSYGLVIDSSASLHSQIEQLLNAAARIVKSNKPADQTFIIRFISSDIMEVMQEPTSDKAVLLDALDKFYIDRGQSAVVDAVYLSAQKLAGQKFSDAELCRKVLILVTDGEDRASFYTQEQLFQLLASNDVQIFTIGLTKDLKGSSRDKATKLLNKLGTETGGRTYFAAAPADLERISGEIIDDIRKQYVIGYQSSGGDARKQFHKVQVSISENANQEKRVAITRVGYQSRSK